MGIEVAQGATLLNLPLNDSNFSFVVAMPKRDKSKKQSTYSQSMLSYTLNRFVFRAIETNMEFPLPSNFFPFILNPKNIPTEDVSNNIELACIPGHGSR